MQRFFKRWIDTKAKFVQTLLLLGLMGFCPPDFRKVATIETPIRYATTDKMEQLYLVLPNNEIVKYTPDGVAQFRFVDRSLGNVGHLDATNPFQILVYYPDFQTVVFLDRTLNELNRVNLAALSFFQPQAVALSNDNFIWLYDAATFQLKKINHTGEILLESPDLGSAFANLFPTFLVESNNQLFLYNQSDRRVLVFDNFGQFKKSYFLKEQAETLNIPPFQILNGFIFYSSYQNFYQINWLNFEEKPLDLPRRLEAGESLQIRGNRWFLVSPNGVEIYECP